MAECTSRLSLGKGLIANTDHSPISQGFFESTEPQLTFQPRLADLFSGFYKSGLHFSLLTGNSNISLLKRLFHNSSLLITRIQLYLFANKYCSIQRGKNKHILAT